ncbi:auxin efflux carrier [Candidatus Omnitrophus magneticus]|uniref:Auxin efflux carrier n=1 Tax=Candidatus Omnitrophus magneticus TaxID=1609969 RepID=A0A0F0CL53_9BACT|nr:auxin efflux carrier [Candidatus Omnitrophus magneticus]
MNTLFFNTTDAIIKLYILIFFGYILYRVKLIDDNFSDKLSVLVVNIIFPALIISKIIKSFNPDAYPMWWIMPLWAMVFCVTGMALGYFVFSCLKQPHSKREFISAVGFQNSGYLPMNLILFLFSGLEKDKFLIYLFLFLAGFNVLMWSWAPVFLTAGKRKVSKRELFINPALWGTVFSVIWVLFFGRDTIPKLILEPIEQIGNMAFPLTMITLGAYLAMHSAIIPKQKLLVVSAVLVKLVLFPLAIFLFLWFFPFSKDYRIFLFIEAIMPSAVSLVFIGAYTGSDNKFLSSVIFYSHALSVITIPLWMKFFSKFF